MVETWIADCLHDFYRISLHCQEILLDEQTDYQHIQVIDTDFFGKVLLLDGVIQLTEFDNAGYHEMITHVPLLACDNPRQVLIIGGGDGGTLQQVLRYPSLDQVTVCELDVRVVEVCRQYFPDFGHPFGDNRTQLVIQDAFEYLKEGNRKFDVIIADTTDPIGKAERLFTTEFYKLMAAALADRGVIVTQCEQLYFDSQFIKQMMGIAKTLAEHAVYYHTLVPTYPGGGIGFLYVSDTSWQNGLGKPYPGKMRYLNPAIHQAAFALPEFLNDILE